MWDKVRLMGTSPRDRIYCEDLDENKLLMKALTVAALLGAGCRI